MNALFVLCGLGIISLLAEITSIRKGLSLVIVIGIAGATFLLTLDWNTALRYYSDMVVFDNFAIAFSALISITTIFWFWMSNDYFQDQSYKTDRSALIVFVVLGATLMASFNNMAMLFLGVEILSISLYVLVGSNKKSLRSNEASFKYFLMGSFATGFLLMGMALVYGATGSFDISKIAAYLANHSTTLPRFFYIGVLLMFVGIVFKMSAVPFHFWAPDVYEGSPTSITAFMSTVVKIAAVGAFYKIFSVCFVSVQNTWSIVLQIIIVLTLVIPNLTAVYQTNAKRILAYSSIGHIGYLLLALLAQGNAAAVLFYYLTAYAVASIAAFSVLNFIEQGGGDSSVESFHGLFKRNSLMAVTMVMALLSLAGIPPLAGFFGKYMVFATAIEHGYTSFVILAVITSLIGVYYYFRIISVIFFKDSGKVEFMLPRSTKILFIILILLNLLIGLFPQTLISLLDV
jgi:NADH-quinone oxidoreductase subunit N